MLEAPEESEGLWPEHVPAVEAFLAVQGQWRTSSATLQNGAIRTIWIGLDYASCEAGLRLAGIDVTARLWTELQVVEQGASAALNGD